MSRGAQLDPSEVAPAGGAMPRWRSLRDFATSVLADSGRRGRVALVLVIAGALFEGLGLALLIPIIGAALGSQNAEMRQAIEWAAAMIGGDRATLLVAALAMFLAVMIVRASVIYARDRTIWHVQTDFVTKQRNRTVGQLAETRWSDLARLDHAKITSQLGSEIGRISSATTMLSQIIVATGMLAVQATLALLIAPGLAALVIGLFVLLAIPIVQRLGRVSALGRHTNRANVELMAIIAQLLGGLKVALAQDMGARFTRDFAALQASHVAYQREYATSRARDQLIFALATAVAAALLVGIGIGVFAVSSTILVTMIVIFGRIAGPIRSLQQSIPQLFHLLPAFESITTLRQSLASAHAEPRPPMPLAEGALAFRDARYLHPQGRGLHRASFSIAPSEIIGICGASGGGKTTLLDLAAGLLTPQSGSICVGGTPLDDRTIAAWQQRIAYATQDPFLFNSSVRHNLTWGSPADDDALWQAIDTVGATALVRRLPAGLDAILGERGTMLSGGERQRLVLARALLRRPRFLILDEATSSLDSASEAGVLAAFKSLSPRPAILFVTHRAESLAHCDRVLTMDEGEICG